MSQTLTLESLNDSALLSQFGDLVRQDHEGNANLLRHIDAIDRRPLWAQLGYPSMFAFLVSRYHMSENHEQVLAAAKHKTIRQIEELVARLAPQPDVPATLRALPTHTTPAPAPTLAS